MTYPQTNLLILATTSRFVLALQGVYLYPKRPALAMNRLPRFYVYLLLCHEDGSTYTGYTANLRRRFKQHNNPDNTGYTRGRRWHLLAVKCFLDRDTALLFEKQIKRWYHGRGNWQRDRWIRQARPRLKVLSNRYGIPTENLK